MHGVGVHMPRQPRSTGLASTRPGAAVARSVTGRGGAEPPKPGQPARLRLVSGAGQPAEERPRPLVVFLGVGDDRRSRLAAALLGWRSWPPSTEVLERAAVVVVMGYDDGALDGCSARAEDWFIDDPCGKDPETVRYLRDAIDRRVQRLLIHLGGAGPSSRPAPRQPRQP